jgi:tetratricopeptide (TPR) repeat protein
MMRWKNFVAALPIRVACLIGAWTSYQIAFADRKSREGTEGSFRAAISARPNHYLHYWQLAQAGTPDSRDLLRKAIRLNPYNAGPMIDLATALEGGGDLEAAEEWLLEANRVDKTYFPRWSLANFQLRRGREPEFWQWARRAAEVGCEDMTALFDLCRRVEPDVEKLTAALIPDRSHAIYNFLTYLAKRNLAPGAGLCERAIRHPDPNRVFHLSVAVQGQLEARRLDDARRTWNAMEAAALVRPPGEIPAADSGMGLAWRLPPVEGVFVASSGQGVEFYLSGRQPATSVLCERILILDPSTEYQVIHKSRSTGSTGGGIRRKVILDSGGQFYTADLTGGPGEPIRFRTGASDRLARLVLVAERPSGATRAKGVFTVESVRIGPAGSRAIS